MLSESLSGGALTITRAVSGTGTVGTDLAEEVAVSGDAHELKILSIETVKDNGKAARKVNIWTNGAEEAYVMHQIGVYGTLNGGPDETLLALPTPSWTASPSWCWQSRARILTPAPTLS